VTIRRLILAASILLPICLPLNAQEKPVPPGRSGFVPADSTAPASPPPVPSITLPEFEIPGTEVIHLDQGSKVPVNDSWAMRNSTIAKTPGERGSPITQLGVAETAGLAGGVGGLTGRLFAGYESFTTPQFDLSVGASSRSSGLTLRSGYRSSRGHVPDADFQEGEAMVSGDTDLGGGTLFPGAPSLGGTVGFGGRSYQPYGSMTPGLERSVNRFHGGVTLSGNGEDDDMSYDLGISVSNTSLVDNATSRGTEAGLFSSVGLPVDQVYMRISAEAWRDDYSSPSRSQDPYLLGGGVSVQYYLARNLQITGGLGLYSVRGSKDGASLRFLPSAGVTWQSSDWLNLEARFTPFIQRSGLSNILDRNPYIINDIDIMYPEYHTNLELAAEVDPSSVIGGSLVLRYQRVRNLPVYVEQFSGAATPPSNNLWNGLWGVEYSGTTRIFGLDAELSAALTQASVLLVSFAWRDIDNPTLGGDIPYAPEVQGGVLYRHELPFGFTVQTDLKLLGAQYAEFNKTARLKGYTVWNAQLEYRALPPFSLGVRVMDILDQSFQQWRGYVERPRTAMLYGRYIW